MIVRGKYAALEEDDGGGEGDTPTIGDRQQNYIK